MKTSRLSFTFLFLLVGFLVSAAPTVRIKDIAYLRGVRENQLVGIGLVTGLAGRGDSSNSELLKSAIANLVANFGFRIDAADVRSRNCAVVSVSCELPPFVRTGEAVDVLVSSIGDARSLVGGILLQTPLKAANGNVYGLAQGQIFTTVSASGGSQNTVGTVPRGAIIEQDVLSEFVAENAVSVVLRHPDFVTANTVATAIRQSYPDIALQAVDAALVEVQIPVDRRQDPVGFVAELESIEIIPEQSNRVVIDSTSGVIIFGERVRIGKVAVSYRNISVNVGPFGRTAGGLLDGQTAEQNFTFEETTTVEDLVETLRAIGLDTEMIIPIIKAIDRAGSLYGTLIIM